MHYSFISIPVLFHNSLKLEDKIEDTVLGQIIEYNKEYLYLDSLKKTNNYKLAELNNINIIENPWLFYKYIYKPDMKLSLFTLKMLIGLEVAPTVAVVTDDDILDTLNAYLIKSKIADGLINIYCRDDGLSTALYDKMDISTKQITEFYTKYSSKSMIHANSHPTFISRNTDDYIVYAGEDRMYLSSINMFNTDKFTEYREEHMRYLFVDLDYRFVIEYLSTRMQHGTAYSTAVRELRQRYSDFVIVIR